MIYKMTVYALCKSHFRSKTTRRCVNIVDTAQIIGHDNLFIGNVYKQSPFNTQILDLVHHNPLTRDGSDLNFTNSHDLTQLMFRFYSPMHQALHATDTSYNLYKLHFMTLFCLYIFDENDVSNRVMLLYQYIGPNRSSYTWRITSHFINFFSPTMKKRRVNIPDTETVIYSSAYGYFN